MMAAGGMSKKGYAAGGMLQQIKDKIVPKSTGAAGSNTPPPGRVRKDPGYGVGPIRGIVVNDPDRTGGNKPKPVVNDPDRTGGNKPRPRTPLAQAIDMPKPRPRKPLAQAIDMPKPRPTKMANGGAVKAAAKKKK